MSKITSTVTTNNDEVVSIPSTRTQLAPVWEPIETAPKDQTSVLLLILVDDEYIIDIGFYGGDNILWVTNDPSISRCMPKCWMPLPDPPQAEEN